uniref:Hexosyltransferase n=1 Tax=Trichuris muris TaxID=70415 RepID=A0A5S6PZZ8_TRIMR
MAFKNVVILLCGVVVGCLFSRLSLLLLQADRSTVRHCVSDSFWSAGANVAHSSDARGNESQKWTTKNRPRFLATELATRERLLVASLSSADGLSSFGLALANATKPTEASILYYVGKDKVISNRRDVVSLLEPSPLSMLENIARNKVDVFDFYLLVPEATYVNGFALDKLLKTMTAGDHLVLGFAQAGSQCSFESGILISNSALKELAPRLVHCASMNRPNSGTYPYSIEQCIRDYSTLQCAVEWKGRPLMSTYIDENGENWATYTGDIVTVVKARQIEQHRKLNMRFADYELSLMKAQLDALIEEIMELHSRSNETISLPLGLAEPWKSVKRHDLLLWDFFDGQNMFDISNQWNVAPLSSVEQSDISAVTSYAVRWLRSKGKTEGFRFQKLLNGYRRFDPVRGMEYTMDLEFADTTGRLRNRRVYLLKSLGKSSILPVPFVTEATTVTLLLPVTVADIEAASEFLAEFRENYLESGENCKLVTLLLMRHDKSEYALFRPLMQTLNAWRLKLRSTARSDRIVYFTLRVQRHSLQSVLDFFVQKLRQPELIFLVSPWIEVNTEMLNRVRLSTIERFQVFFPVPFVRYHTAFAPTTTANKEPRMQFNINRDSGHFDLLNFDLASFYSSDYLRARSLLASKDNLFYLFCMAGQFHVLRAVDPTFRLRHPNRHCQSHLDNVERDQCIVRQNENLGSKAQLASYLFSQS